MIGATKHSDAEPRSSPCRRRLSRAARGVLLILGSVVFLHVTASAPEPAHALDAQVAGGAGCSGLSGGGAAPDTGTRPEQALRLPPRRPDPTVVAVGLFVIQISEIDESSNTFVLQAFLDLVWCDRRLAFDADAAGFTREVSPGKLAADRSLHMWWPDVQILNQVEPRQVENEELLIDSDGTVEYRERFRAVVASDYHMRRFPFDRQRLLVHLESFAWPDTDLQFETIEQLVGFSDEFHIPGWTVTGVEERIGSRQEVRERAQFSALTATITVARDPGFFVVKIMLPLAVIVVAVAAALWMPAAELASRVGATLTALLTATAFGFVVANYVPNHVYRTYLDAVLLSSFVFPALLMAEHVAANVLHHSRGPEAALRLDRVFRVAYPLGYLTLEALLFAIY